MTKGGCLYIFLIDQIIKLKFYERYQSQAFDLSRSNITLYFDADRELRKIYSSGAFIALK